MNGQIDILNCGTGHTEVKVDTSDPIQTERACRIISDMLRRGYVLFIEDADGKLTRVEKFDEKRQVYIVGDGPLYAGDTTPAPQFPDGVIKPVADPAPAKRGPGRPRREVPVTTAKATAIARTAGG